MLNLVGQVETVLVTEREREGKVGRLVLRVSEHVAKLQSELVVAVKEGRDFSHDPSPLLLLTRHHSERRLQALVV